MKDYQLEKKNEKKKIQNGVTDLPGNLRFLSSFLLFLLCRILKIKLWRVAFGFDRFVAKKFWDIFLHST